MTNEELLEKMQEDMEMRRIFKIYEIFILSYSRESNKIFWKANRDGDNKRIKRIFNEILERKKEIKWKEYKLS